MALTRVGPVGVDVEEIKAGVDDGMALECLNADEPMRRPRDFFTYWCRKESVVKATGDGLHAPLAQVVVTPADEPPRLVSYLGQRLNATIVDLDVGRGYAGAATVLCEQDVSVRVDDAARLLVASSR